MGSENGITPETKPQVRTDGVSIFWLTFGSVWTVILLGGILFLHVNRRMPLLRIRGLYLSFAAISLLHPYWLICQFVYTIGPVMPEVVEYWVMGLYLPFGMALFQASNSQFLNVARAQKKFLTSKGAPLTKSKSASDSGKGPLGRVKRMNYSTRVFTYVLIGMMFQLFLAVFMYLISRKFHSSFGIPGTGVHGTPMEQKSQQGRGWEWWPSIVWQFLWAWVIAPIIIWQARGIHDTLGWRVQTIGCCIAGLHATPMWLIAIYVPAMAPVNAYFAPPQWICVSIMIIEIFTIFLPCWQVLRHKTLRQETLEAIAAWESKNKTGGTRNESLFSGSTQVSKSKSENFKSLSNAERGGSLDSSQCGGIYTMEALESVLERNPEPLREFSALRDFSGENIAFLTSVAEWKASLPPSATKATKEGGGDDDDDNNNDSNTRELVRERFNSALRIYADFISPRDAEFCINIASHDLKRLEAVFEKAVRILYGDRESLNPATPFEDFDRSSAAPSSSQGSEKPIADQVQYWGEIPEEFGADVFDDAEKSIKYLVLTNTWPKFVRERRYSIDSNDSGFTLESHDSNTTLSRALRYLNSMKSTWSLKT